MAFAGAQREIFLPGRSTSGHHVFEQSCRSCHLAFSGVPNDRCAACHKAELARDSHPAALFDSPRWVGQGPAAIDVRRCASCHRGHQGGARGVTVAADFCVSCHADVLKSRESHRGFSNVSCATTACHNFHDNSALNVAFLSRHLDEPDLLAAPQTLEWQSRRPSERPVAAPPPLGLEVPAELDEAWKQSAHAYHSVDCAACHRTAAGATVPRPSDDACRRCHEFEANTFASGQHGVRAAQGLPPLRPADARLSMKAPRDRTIGCQTCHDPHRLDTARAAVASCLGCHDDEHSRAFTRSPHARLASHPASPHATEAVTCATCHMPRVRGGERVAVNHSNTFTLRPRDRMAAAVCARCHGLAFALASLADGRLVANNFSGRPSARLRTFDMVRAASGKDTRRPEDRQ